MRAARKKKNILQRDEEEEEEEGRKRRGGSRGRCKLESVSVLPVVMRLPAKRSQTQTVADSLLNIITGLHPGAEVLAEPLKAVV